MSTSTSSWLSYYAFEINIKLISTIHANLVFAPTLSTLAATRYSLAEDTLEKSNNGYETSSIPPSCPLPFGE
jgi:hypothetical protein